MIVHQRQLQMRRGWQQASTFPIQRDFAANWWIRRLTKPNPARLRVVNLAAVSAPQTTTNTQY
jgi:hypothetical protein